MAPWPALPTPSPANFLDHFPGSSLDAAKWSSVTSGTGAVTVTDSYVDLNAPANSAAFIYRPVKLDKTKSQLWLLTMGPGPSSNAGAGMMGLVNGASAPVADTQANIDGKYLVRRDFSNQAGAPSSLVLFDNHWSSGGTQTFWDHTNDQWTASYTNALYTLSPIQADDYYVLGVEFDGINARWRLHAWSHSFPTAGTWQFDQGLCQWSVTDWVNWSATRSNSDVWLVVGQLYNDDGTARRVRVESVKYVESNDASNRVIDGWVASKDALADAHRIRHVYSYDGQTFLLENQNQWALDLGAGSPDNTEIQEPFVVYDGVSTDWMFYMGITGTTKSLCVASAPHVTGAAQGQTATFTRYVSNPILSLGSAGQFDDQEVRFPHVIVDYTEGDPNKRWKMLYAGKKASDGKLRMGLATAPSPTGTWTKQGMILDVGTTGANDEGSVFGMCAVYIEGTWEVWYEGVKGTSENGVRHLLRATSTDGLTTLTKDGVDYYSPPTTTASQSLTANLTAAPGRTVTMADTTGYVVDANVAFSQNSTNDDVSVSRIRKIVSSTQIELYHGLTGFTTTYPAKIKQIASTPNFTPRTMRRVGAEWWFYLTVWEPFHNAPESGYDSLLEDTYLFKHGGINPADATPAIDHTLGTAGSRNIYQGRRSFENLTFLNEPLFPVDNRPSGFSFPSRMGIGVLRFLAAGGGDRIEFQVTGIESAGVVYQSAGSITASALVSGADVFEASESGSVTGSGLVSGADTFTAAEAGAVWAGVLVAGADSFQPAETGALATQALASGADVFQASETGSLTATGLVSAADVFEGTETGTVRANGFVSAADVFQAVETGAIYTNGVVSGTSSTVAGTVYQKTGALFATGRLFGADSFVAAESGAAAAASLLAGGDSFQPAETGSLTPRALSSAADAWTTVRTGSVIAGTRISGPSIAGDVKGCVTLTITTVASATLTASTAANATLGQAAVASAELAAEVC